MCLHDRSNAIKFEKNAILLKIPLKFRPFFTGSSVHNHWTSVQLFWLNSQSEYGLKGSWISFKLPTDNLHFWQEKIAIYPVASLPLLNGVFPSETANIISSQSQSSSYENLNSLFTLWKLNYTYMYMLYCITHTQFPFPLTPLSASRNEPLVATVSPWKEMTRTVATVARKWCLINVDDHASL